MLMGKFGVGLEQIARGGLACQAQLSGRLDHLSLSEGMGAEERGRDWTVPAHWLTDSGWCLMLPPGKLCAMEEQGASC